MRGVHDKKAKERGKMLYYGLARIATYDSCMKGGTVPRLEATGKVRLLLDLLDKNLIFLVQV